MPRWRSVHHCLDQSTHRIGSYIIRFHRLNPQICYRFLTLLRSIFSQNQVLGFQFSSPIRKWVQLEQPKVEEASQRQPNQFPDLQRPAFNFPSEESQDSSRPVNTPNVLVPELRSTFPPSWSISLLRFVSFLQFPFHYLFCLIYGSKSNCIDSNCWLGFGIGWKRCKGQQEESYCTKAHSACCEERWRTQQAFGNCDHC